MFKNILSEFVTVEVRSNVEGEVDGRDETECTTDEVGESKRCMLRYYASEYESETDADIPRGEIGGVGCATLVMLCKIDK